MPIRSCCLLPEEGGKLDDDAQEREEVVVEHDIEVRPRPEDQVDEQVHQQLQIAWRLGVRDGAVNPALKLGERVLVFPDLEHDVFSSVLNFRREGLREQVVDVDDETERDERLDNHL